MKKEIAQKWCEALRSGEYIQGKQYLQKGNKFCCLGVLCDLATKEGVCNKSIDLYNIADFDKYFCGLPKSVIDWSGMKSRHGMYDDQKTLATCNDSLNKTFSEIADIIEEKWEQL